MTTALTGMDWSSGEALRAMAWAWERQPGAATIATIVIIGIIGIMAPVRLRPGAAPR